MAVKVAINGFGRIGRLAFRQMFGAEGFGMGKILLSCFVMLQEVLSVLICLQSLWNSNTPLNSFRN